MHLLNATLGKLIRESLVTKAPLVLDKDGVANLKQRLETWFAHVDELGMCWLDKKGENWRPLDHYLCGIGCLSPGCGPIHYGEFTIGLYAKRCLGLCYKTYDPPHPVGSVDELFTLLSRCQERAVRMRGRDAKKTKVRKLRGASILAQVQELARTFRFDYRVVESSGAIDLSIRLDGKHVLEVHVPRAKPEDVLSQLKESLPHLRQMFGATLSATVRLNCRGSAIRGAWVLHQSLGQDEPTEQKE